MQVYNVTPLNTIPLTANYPYDKDIMLDREVLYTENYLNLPLEQAFYKANDNVINNFSNLFLTFKQKLEDIVSVKPLSELPDEGFSTYLAVNAINYVTPYSKFWTVEEPPISATSSFFRVSGLFENIDNNNFFEIILLDDYLCKIAHENDGVKRYLTLDYTGNLLFAKDANCDFLEKYSPQIFYYIYDRQNDYIVFAKNSYDIIKFLKFNPASQKIVLSDNLSGSSLPFTTNCIFRCVKRNEAPNYTRIQDPWVSYKKDSNNYKLPVNPDRSYEDVENNFLINNEYYNNDRLLNVNILSLKNTHTPEGYQTRNNVFFAEQKVNVKDYQKLFTGSNQLYGNDSITVGYEAYTNNIKLLKDKVTYFHTPQVYHPFYRVNVNDSGLVESGAIAGDHPLKSDKIFKKLADYKYTSYFGNTIDENSGTFLCAWLSGNPNLDAKPIWIDRYYNPSKISFYGALSSEPFNAVEYISQFECLMNQLPSNIDVFDKPSDLIFEPGCYFAYQHIGNNFATGYLNSLSSYIIQRNFNIYKTVSGGDAIDAADFKEEYYFNGENYALTDSLSALKSSKGFTAIFDLYSEDWTKPFAYQLFGNYNSDGVGIFNVNYLTPTLFIIDNNKIYIKTENFVTLNTVEFKFKVLGALRLEGFSDYFVILNNGDFIKLNGQNLEIYKINNPNLAYAISWDYDETYAYVLCKLPTNVRQLYKIELRNGKIENITSQTQLFNFSTYITLNAATTVNVYKNYLYFTNGRDSKRYKSTIFYTNSTSVFKWDNINSAEVLVKKAFTSFKPINYNIDMNGNVFVVLENKFMKYDSSLVLQTSGFVPQGLSARSIDFFYELEGNTINEETFVTSVCSNNTLVYSKFNNSYNLISSFKLTSSELNYSNLTQIDYLREYVKDLYPEHSLNARIYLNNVYNLLDIQKSNLILDLSGLDPGYHNFCLRVDTYKGYMHFIVDGKIASYTQFTPRKFIFSDIVNRPFFFGTSPYLNSIPSFEYLQDNNFNTYGVKLKNFYLYKEPLNYFDIMFHNKANSEITDIILDLPAGRRNYLEEIERYFKNRTPGNKSTLCNIVLKNSGIANSGLKNEIEKRILTVLRESLPAYLKVNNIKWSS